jgi:putative transposase
MNWGELRKSPSFSILQALGEPTMPGKAAKVIVTERQMAALQKMAGSSTCPQGVAQRARMIVLAFAGQTNETIAQMVQCERHMVGVWRRRWVRAFARLVLVECGEKPSALPRAIERLLSDSPRRGWAGKFSAEQVAQIIAVACEPPEKCGRPVTHWTPRELADEVKKRSIVPSISARQVGRFLKGGRSPTASKPVLAERRAQRQGGVSASGGGGVPMLS